MSPRRLALLATPLLVGAIAAPALAHPGDHHGLTLAQLVSHYASGWHALPILIGAAGALVVLLLKPASEARAKLPAKKRPRDGA